MPWPIYVLGGLWVVLIVYYLGRSGLVLFLNRRIVTLRQRGDFARAIPAARRMAWGTRSALWVTRLVQPLLQRSQADGVLSGYSQALSLLASLHHELGEMDEA